MSVDPVGMLTGGLVDSKGNIGGGLMSGGLPGLGSGGGGGLGGMLPGLPGLSGSSSGGGLLPGLPGLGGGTSANGNMGISLPGLDFLGGSSGLGGFGIGGANGMNFLNPMSMFSGMMGSTGSKIPMQIPQAYQIPSTFKPGTYDFGNQSLPKQTTAQAAPPAPTVNMMQQQRQVPQGTAVGSVNNLTPQYNSAIAYGR